MILWLTLHINELVKTHQIKPFLMIRHATLKGFYLKILNKSKESHSLIIKKSLYILNSIPKIQDTKMSLKTLTIRSSIKR